jgi:phosphatidate phosphatase APP1
MRVKLAGLLLLAAVGLNAERGLAACELAPDDDVLFFPSVATWDAAHQVWDVPIHAWIFQPETHSVKRHLLLSALRHSLGIHEHEAANQLFQERARPFLVDNKQKVVQITLQGQAFSLKRTDMGGHVEDHVWTASLPDSQWTTYQFFGCPGDPRTFSGKVWAAREPHHLIVSDIDDTIKVTNVLDKDAMLANTFLRPYEAIPGMGPLFTTWAKQDPTSVFFYLSASPWQLFSPLSAFLKAAGFPDGLLYLKRFRWKDRSFFSLFESPEDYKGPILKQLVEQFPTGKFTLLGDTTEKDPEIYVAFARAHPDRVEHIYIRDTGPGEQTARLSQAFAGLPAPLWSRFQNGTDLLASGGSR